MEHANGELAVNRFELKRLPIKCVVNGASPIATEMRIIVWRRIAVDGSGRFAGTQKTVTNELRGFPEAASTVATSLKGRLSSNGRSAEGVIELRSHGVQLIPGGRVVAECATRGWVHWSATA